MNSYKMTFPQDWLNTRDRSKSSETLLMLKKRKKNNI